MRERPRRRRSELETSRRGGLPLLPLIVVVVLTGLLLGGVLAHFFGGSKGNPLTAPTSIAIAPATSEPTLPPTPLTKTAPLSSASPAHSTSPVKSPTPKASVAAPSAPTPPPSSPKSTATPAHVASPSVQSTGSPVVPAVSWPQPYATTRSKAVAPVTAGRSTASAVPLPPASAVAAGGDDRAAAVVRSYLGALAHGDRGGAAAYLAKGSPSETFLDAGAHIASIRAAGVGSGQYRVTADVQTGTGEYYCTFTVESGPGGLQITDHYAIKTQ